MYMYCMHPARTLGLNFEVENWIQTIKTIQNNTVLQSIYEIVFDEYYIAITAPAMWLLVSSCRYACQNDQHTKWWDSAAGAQQIQERKFAGVQ